MKLREVWDYLRPEVRRAIRAVAAESPRLDTPRLLGALIQFQDQDPGAARLATLDRWVGDRLVVPESVPSNPDPCPEELELSPTMNETLNFFRIHHIRDISIARLALRLLQIGSGELVRDLERNDVLSEVLSDLRVTVESEVSPS